MTQFKWTVIGAGPAGIAALGRLLDHGIAPGEVAWIDPAFTAGDIGGKWRPVPSNTRVGLFLEYFNASPSFRFDDAPHFELHDLDPEQTCLLGTVADPLLWVSQHLAERVTVLPTIATELSLHDRQWTVSTEQGAITSTNVILAIGSVPKTLAHPGLAEISIEVALDPVQLEQPPLGGT